MIQRPFRFVHASDLHLERPVAGVVEAPDTLREVLLEASYRAAQRVFEYALAEGAEFVVLPGDVLDAELTGPRGPQFLTMQFERLRQRGIQVYWAGGEIDPPDAWPSAFPLPDNVYRFLQGRAETVLHERGGLPLARLIGAAARRSRRVCVGEFATQRDEVFTIAVAHGAADGESIVEGAVPARSAVDYWALGGRHDRQTQGEGLHVAHDPGATQGCERAEVGAHGCTLVEVGDDSIVQLRELPTDVLRWRRERVAVDPGTSRSHLERLLADRLKTLLAASPGTDLLVSWELHGAGPVVHALRRGSLAGELLSELRRQFSRGSPVGWSVSLEVAAETSLPSDWFRQESLLGDYLRAIGASPPPGAEGPLDLAALLPPRRAQGGWGEALALDDPSARRRVLQLAAALGAEMLQGEESLA